MVAGTGYMILDNEEVVSFCEPRNLIPGTWYVRCRDYF